MNIDHWWPILPIVCFLPIKTSTDESEPRKTMYCIYSFQIPYIFFVRLHDKSAVYIPQTLEDLMTWTSRTGGKCGTTEVAAMGYRIFGFVCGSGDLFGTWSYHHLLHRDAGGRLEPAGCKLNICLGAYWFWVVVSMKDYLFWIRNKWKLWCSVVVSKMPAYSVYIIEKWTHWRPSL